MDLSSVQAFELLAIAIEYLAAFELECWLHLAVLFALSSARRRVSIDLEKESSEMELFLSNSRLNSA
jgi:hypothetical protein